MASKHVKAAARAILLLAISLTLAYLIGPGHVHEHIEIGEKAPLSLEVRSFDGKSWPLEHLAAKPLLINFWATWCPSCTAELPMLAHFAKENASHLHVVGVVIDSPAEEVKNTVQRFGVTYPVAAAPFSVVQAFGAEALPSTYVVDTDHTLLWRKHGALDKKDLEDISRLLMKPKAERLRELGKAQHHG